MHECHHQRPTRAAAFLRLALLTALAAALPAPAAAQQANPMCTDSGTVVHPGEIRAGTLTSASCRTPGGQYYQAFLLVLTSPQDLAVAVRSTDASVDPLLRIEHRGQSVQDDNGGGGRDALKSGRFDAGTWRIVALNATAGQGGSFELSLEPTGKGATECARRVIALGERRRGTFGPGGCKVGDAPFVAHHRLTLTEDRAVELVLESADFSPQLRLFDADGDEVEDEESADVARIRRKLKAGTYLIEAGPNGRDGVGGYELAVTAIPVPRGGACKPSDADDRFEVGEQLKGDLARNDCVDEELFTDILLPANYHRLEVGRNMRLRLELRTGLEDAVARLYDAGGDYVGSADDTLFAFVRRGVYYVQVSAPTRGGYTLAAERDEKTVGETRCSRASAVDEVEVGRSYKRELGRLACEHVLSSGSYEVLRLVVKERQAVTVHPTSDRLQVRAEIQDASGKRLDAKGMDAIMAEVRTGVVRRELGPGTYYIEVTAIGDRRNEDARAPYVGEYRLAIGPEVHTISSIRGLYFSGDYGASGIRPEGGKDWHTNISGWTAQVGLGITSRILLYVQQTNDASAPDDDVIYDIKSRDLGARFYALGDETSFLRLFLEGNVGTREDISKSGAEFEGRGWRTGLGYELFKGPFTFRWTGTYGQNLYHEMSSGGVTREIDDKEHALRMGLGLSLRIPF